MSGGQRHSKEEFVNNFRKSRNLVRKLTWWQVKKVLLTNSQGEKKGNEVADDEDDDAVRTSVSQD